MITNAGRALRHRANLLAVAALLTAAGICFTSPLLAADESGASAAKIKQPLGFQDLFALEEATEIRISPDGTRVAYTRATADVMSDSNHRGLWIIDAATGEQRPTGNGDVGDICWSPDGSRLAYVASDDSGKPQIFVWVLDRGVGHPITNLPQAPGGLAWSPDGHALAFTMFVSEMATTFTVPSLKKPAGANWAPPLTVTTSFRWSADGVGDLPAGHRHLFTVSADGGEPRQVTAGPFDDDAATWLPDGASLLFSSRRGVNRERDLLDAKIFRVQLSDRELTQLTHRQAGDREPVASPDGRLIAYLSIDGVVRDYTPTNLYVANADGSNPRLLAPGLDRDVAQPCWTHDGRGILAAYDDHGVTKIARFDLDGSYLTVVEEVGGDGAFSVSNDEVVAFPLGSSDHPADVAIRRAGETRRLTRLNDDLLRDRIVGETKPLVVVSSVDKAEVGAWTVLPPGYDPARRYPTVLMIHGGPYGSDGPFWDVDRQLFAAAGYVVLYANYRGSISYGFAFANRIDRDFPGPAYDDLMSAVDAAVAQGISDPEQLFVTGGSAGGELTAWIVGKTNRFKAAAAVKPVINLLSNSLGSDQFIAGSKYLFGVPPWEDAGLFWSHSPLSLVGNVRTPTLLMVGTEDLRTPPSESIQFYNALQLRGIPTALVRVLGASHESLESRPSQRAAENAVVLDWFALHGSLAAPVRATGDTDHR